MEIQLKPCPFCGHPGEHKLIKPYRKMGGVQYYLAEVGCSYYGCTARMTQAAADKETAWKYASDMWNRREEPTVPTPEQVEALKDDRDAWRKRAEAVEAEIGRLKEKVCASFEKSDQLIKDQSDFVEELQRRLVTAEKVCHAAHMYVKHINSPLCVGWDMLLDALRKWTDERRGPRSESKEE